MARRTVVPAEISSLAQGLAMRCVGSAVVTGMSDDSRTVEPGDLFFCVRGGTHDGHDHAAAAVAAGARALVIERDVAGIAPGVARVVVEDVRSAVGPIADRLAGSPSAALRMVGVTGTNGKTSTASFLAEICGYAGLHPFVIGTLSGQRTTPEPVVLHGLLADALAAGADTCIMEVTSHALVLGRVGGIVFDLAVFTNLTRDHLDFHATMEEYFGAKASLFGPAVARRGVVSTDDEWGRRLVESAAIPVTGFSLPPDAEWDMDRSAFGWRGEQVRVPIGGEFTVRNALVAAEAAAALGIDTATVVRACGALSGVPGRFESVPTGSGYRIIVDYAHTPNGLESLLASVNRSATGRVICVFGCGGDRDYGKRPVMGRVVAGLADVAFVTSDNPRGEDPRAIIADIVAGMGSPRGTVTVEEDRAAAIEAAVAGALDGDIVVIAGKGHEAHQEVAGELRAFSDVEAARAAVARRNDRP